MKYRREIDGLRAIAVVPVVLFHAGLGAFSGGYVGVDVFFVISGYLITGILIAENEAGRFSIAKFYERRARRILPALFLVIFAGFAYAWFRLLPQDMRVYSKGMLAVSTFSSNIQFWLDSGYFGPATELNPLIHTWSLSVEEQFYVLFPLLLAMGWRFGRMRVIYVLGAIAVLSFALAQWWSHAAPTAGFFLLPTRAWELLAGALAAVYLSTERMPRAFDEAPSALGVVMIATAVFAFGATTPFPSVYALLPVVGTVLIILFAGEHTVIGRILGSRMLVGLGLVSYSLYLWHQPLFAFARDASATAPPVEFLLLLALLSLVLAGLTWRFVEQPFRDRAKVSRHEVVRMAVVGTMFLGVAGALGRATTGFEMRLSDRQAPIWSAAKVTLATPGRMVDQGCRFHSVKVDQAFKQRFTSCAKQYGRAVIVLGDSHAMNMFNAMAKNTTAPFVVGLGNGGCRPHGAPAPDCSLEDYRRFLSDSKARVERVFYTQAGFYLFKSKHDEIGSRSMFELADVPRFEVNTALIDQVLAYLEGIDAPVVWLTPRFAHHQNVRHVVRSALKCQQQAPAIDPDVLANYAELDALLRSRVGSNQHVSMFPAFHAIGFDPATDLFDCNAVYWSDGDHWSEEGEKRFGQRIVRSLTASRLL